MGKKDGCGNMQLENLAFQCLGYVQFTLFLLISDLISSDHISLDHAYNFFFFEGKQNRLY